MSATFEVKPAPPAPAPREAVKTARNIPRTSRRTAARRSLRRHWQLYLLIVVPLAYFVIFKYIPITNAVIAFKDYSPIKGPWGSDWVGFRNFELFFQNPVFWTLVKNTFFLAAYTVLASFPIPIVLAHRAERDPQRPVQEGRSSWSPTRRTSSPPSWSSR